MTIMLNVTPETRVNSTLANNQQRSSVAVLADGTYVVVWETYQQDGSDYGVYMRHYSATGVRLGDEIRVNTYFIGAQGAPDIAATDDGFVVVWNGTAFGDGQTVSSQRFDLNLNPLGPEQNMATSVAFDQYSPAVTGLPGGGYVATWYSIGQDGDGTGCYFQVFDGMGQAVGTESLVANTTAGAQVVPSITTLADGTFVISWQSDNVDGSVSAIVMRQFSATGVALTNEILVNTTTLSTQSNPSIEALADGGFVIAWSGNGPGDGDGVFFQRYNSLLNPVGGETPAATSLSGTQGRPSVAALEDGGFVIAWQSNGGEDGSGFAILSQRFDDGGAKIGPQTVVNTVGAGDQFDPAVAALPGGGMVVTWTTGLSGAFDVQTRVWQDAPNTNGTQYVYGTSGSDRLDGGSGNDKMYGGIGNDTYVVDSYSDLVFEGANVDEDTVESSVTWALDPNFENLVLIGNANLIGYGTEINNILTGNNGNNLLYGYAGGDTLDGGSGNDALFGGVDNDTLIGGASNDLLDGGDGNDVMSCGDGADRVQASVGRDQADGGAGVDTYSSSGLISKAVINLTAGRATHGIGNQTALAGFENITGGMSDDMLIGDGGANLLDGGFGGDAMRGMAGDDTYIVDSVSDVVSELVGGLDSGGEDTVIARFSCALGGYLENLTLDAGGNLTGTGNALDNTIIGYSDDNLLNGGAGVDAMYGGAGNDTYVVDAEFDVASESMSGGDDGGIDLVQQVGSFYALGAFIENLTMTGAGASVAYGNLTDNVLTGNGIDNLMFGLDGNDTINGLVGADQMYGGSGNDTYFVDNIGDLVSEARFGFDETGVDQVRSTVNYTLGDYVERLALTGGSAISGTGNALNNVIAGNGSANRIEGKAGNDNLSGGAGADIFVFAKYGTSNGVDTITDFVSGVDKLSFTATDYGFTAPHTLLASEISFTGVAVGANAQFVFNNANRVLYWDTNGSAAGGLNTIVVLTGSAPVIGDFIFS